MNKLLLLLCLALASGAAALAVTRHQQFPHERHARLFPLCTGCHEGVPTEDRTQFFPAPQLCSGCHNGTQARPVSWSGPTTHESNLRFSHQEHEANTGGDLECSACHTKEAADRMAVEHAVADRCFACHEGGHLVDAPCQQCHVPLGQTRLAVTRIERLPRPPSHEQADFLESVHGRLAPSNIQQCAVCHTRERCAACHVDAASRAEVIAMPAAAEQLALPAMTARYFVPDSHTRPDWIETHGKDARNVASCSSCHTRESCATCHAVHAPKAVQALPARAGVTAQGVRTTRRAPASHAAPLFEQRHSTLAAAKGQTCTSCHTRTQCEQCHNAALVGRNVSNTKSARSDFHPGNFLQRHASAAYGRNLECSNCHEASRFCRDCHERTGMGTSGRLQAGFHDAQPFWLLNHAKPARQGLESCTTCHKQTDCLQCHSTIGAFRVSPHGPGFDAKRVQSKNARICFACHLSDPLQRSSQ